MNYNTAAGVYAFGALTPVIAGREGSLRKYLRSLPTGLESPLSRLTDTHFARWLIITEPSYEGPPQKPDNLKSNYLVFTAYVDGTSPDQFLADLITRCPEAHEVWTHCVGYPGPDPDRFRRYMKHNQLETALFYPGYGATVAHVRACLALRDRLLAFAVAHEGADDQTLLDDWRETFRSDGMQG